MSSSVLAFLAADMRARGMATGTIDAYSRIVAPFVADHPDLESLDRLTVSEWVQGADTKSKQRHRYLAVNALCRALVEDGTLACNPCLAIKMPIEALAPQPSLSDADYDALLAGCDVRTFIGKRDRAILAVLDSTGCRVAELAAIEVRDVDLSGGEILIRHPKRDRNGLARMRQVFLNDDAVRALASWMRVRERVAFGTYLWTNQGGKPLLRNGIQQMVRRRGKALSIVVSPHQFRRRLATGWLLDGGSETGLKKVGGWQSGVMPSRYAAAGVLEIARADHARLFANKRNGQRGRTGA